MAKRKREKPGYQQLRGRDRSHRTGDAYWIYGRHSAQAVLLNPRRTVRRILATRNAAEALDGARAPLEVVSAEEIARLLPADAVHQGLAVLAQPLKVLDLDDLGNTDAPVVVLDQVTDPHNIGAILRSAAAFGATGLVLQDRHSPPETGALAKAASGALEWVPLFRVTNIARSLDELAERGYARLGLDGEAPQTLGEVVGEGRVALVLGAEGKGLRRLTRERCDLLARIETSGALASLNVSNAAAIALYEISKARRASAPVTAAAGSS